MRGPSQWGKLFLDASDCFYQGLIDHVFFAGNHACASSSSSSSSSPCKGPYCTAHRHASATVCQQGPHGGDLLDKPSTASAATTDKQAGSKSSNRYRHTPCFRTPRRLTGMWQQNPQPQHCYPALLSHPHLCSSQTPSQPRLLSHHGDEFYLLNPKLITHVITRIRCVSHPRSIIRRVVRFLDPQMLSQGVGYTPSYAVPLVTLLERQSRFGEKPAKFQVVYPKTGTAVLTGLRPTRDKQNKYL